MTVLTTVAKPIRRHTVPRWAVILAHVAAVTPVLSSLWRLPIIFGFSMGLDDIDTMMSHPLWLRAGYLPLLAWGPLVLAVTWSYARRRSLSLPFGR